LIEPEAPASEEEDFFDPSTDFIVADDSLSDVTIDSSLDDLIDELVKDTEKPVLPPSTSSAVINCKDQSVV
jgi:hypothetical protein